MSAALLHRESICFCKGPNTPTARGWQYFVTAMEASGKSHCGTTKFNEEMFSNARKWWSIIFQLLQFAEETIKEITSVVGRIVIVVAALSWSENVLIYDQARFYEMSTDSERGRRELSIELISSHKLLEFRELHEVKFQCFLTCQLLSLV